MGDYKKLNRKRVLDKDCTQELDQVIESSTIGLFTAAFEASSAAILPWPSRTSDVPMLFFSKPRNGLLRLW